MTTESGIYQIRHIESGKIYVGSAVNIKQRWHVHRHDLIKGSHHSQRLQNAWNKYGSDQFVFEVLEIVENKENLISMEQQYIDRLRSWDHSVGYNICSKAGSMLGTKRNAETRAKISAAGKGKLRGRPFEKGCKHSPEMKAKTASTRKLRGYKHTSESRAKISIAIKGYKHSPEARARMSAAHRGVPRKRSIRSSQNQMTFSFH